MTDYERQMPMRESGHVHLPRVERSWTIGTVLAATCSVVSLLSVLIAITWGYARVTYATDNIPDMKRKQEANTQDISNLKLQQTYNDAHYAEILLQLSKIDGKVDRLNDSKADKQMKGWQR